MPDLPEVVIRNLSFAYDKELILGGIDMEVQSGDFVCLLGQSGCGKSTLLRLLAGLERTDQGEILVNGKPITKPSLDRVMVFQDYGLFPWMTAGENITIALRKKFKNDTKAELKARAMEWMENVGLNSKVIFDKLPMEISGGQRQRCATARAFAVDAPIMLMDEPFGSLDAVTKALLQDTVLSLWEKEEKEEGKKKTIFFVTHEVDEALLLATDIFIFGQSPSKIIFKHSFHGQKKPQRETMFSDPEVMDLRNQIIRIINEEVNAKAQEYRG